MNSDKKRGIVENTLVYGGFVAIIAFIFNALLQDGSWPLVVKIILIIWAVLGFGVINGAKESNE